MNAREKKLLLVLGLISFLVIGLLVVTSYKAAKKQKEIEWEKGAEELARMEKELAAADSQLEEVEWLSSNNPALGTHGKVGAELATYMENSAKRYHVEIKKRPSPQREDPEETGAFRSARVKVLVAARDGELFRWLTDLQDPKKSRSITFLRISPQRKDATRVDCEMVVTQWFTPEEGDEDDQPPK